MHGDQRMGGAVAAGMDRPGQDFLADAAFAAEQDGCLAGRGLAGHVQGRVHSRLAGLQLHLGRQRANLLLPHVNLGQGLDTIAGFVVSVSEHRKQPIVTYESVHGLRLSLLNRTAVHFE